MLEVSLETKWSFHMDKNNNRKEYLPFKKLISHISSSLKRFPGNSLVVCHGPGSIPGWGTEILQDAWPKKKKKISVSQSMNLLISHNMSPKKKKKFHCNRRIYFATPCVRIWPGGEWAKKKQRLNSTQDGSLGIYWGAVITKILYGSLMFHSYADFIETYKWSSSFICLEEACSKLWSSPCLKIPSGCMPAICSLLLACYFGSNLQKIINLKI